MKIINKFKNTDFIITASFYVCLLLIPAFVQNGSSELSVWTSFFFSRTLNILLCIVPVLLAVFLRKTQLTNSSLLLAIIDTLILFLIQTEFFVSANYFLNLLLAIFILIFLFANINEMLVIAGVIPFFFLSRLGVMHYVITVAIPLIFLLFTKLQTTENKTKKLIIKITLFIQCYTCGFFAILLLSKKYHTNITSTFPQTFTPALITKTVSAILLLIFVAVLYILKNLNRIKEGKTTDKLLIILPVAYFVFTGIAGYFTDILSIKNETSVIFALIYILIFGTQYRLSAPAEKNEKPRFITFIEITTVVLFCLSMLS